MAAGGFGRANGRLGENMVGYKASWSMRDAEISLDAKGMYEAAINNIDWLKPFTDSWESLVLAGDMPTYEELLNVVQVVYTVDKMALASARGKTNERHAVPYLARQHARIASYDFAEYSKNLRASHERQGKPLDDETKHSWCQERDNVLHMWEHTERIAADSGFEYFDRTATRHNAGKFLHPANEALDMFLRDNGHLFHLT